MEKVTEVSKVKSNFHNKPLLMPTANISPLLASNTVQCCYHLLCTKQQNRVLVNSMGNHDAHTVSLHLEGVDSGRDGVSGQTLHHDVKPCHCSMTFLLQKSYL